MNCKKNSMKWIFPIICVLFLVGCGASTPTEYNPHVGKDGLILNFISQAPPSEVYEGQSVAIGLDITNKGAEDITEVKIDIGAERNLFSEFVSSYTRSLEGKRTTLRSVGQKDTIFVTTTAEDVIATEKIDTTIRAQACYPYKTVFATPICVDPDILGEETNKPRECQKRSSQVLSFGSGQGAPVAVKRIEMLMIPTSEDSVTPRVIFEIDKVTKNWIYNKDIILGEKGPCSAFGVSKADIGLIDTSKIFLGQTHLTCNKAQLKTSDAQEGNEYYTRGDIVCNGQPIKTSELAYLTSLTMTLEYGVQTEIEQKLIINTV